MVSIFNRKHVAEPDNMATIDHLRDRFDPLRKINEKKSRSVLSCKKCNNDRSSLRQAALDKEELWERSGRKPREINFGINPAISC